MEPCLHSGFLHKKGAIFTSWKRRFFTLRGQKMTYYVEAGPKHEGDGHPLGYIDLSSAISVSKSQPELSNSWSKTAFMIGTPERCWELTADSEDDRTQWIEFISRTVAPRADRLRIRIHGELIKQGAVVKNWKSRYFICGNEALYYFENQSNAMKFAAIAGSKKDDIPDLVKKSVLGVIPLVDAVPEKLGDFEGRSYTIALQSTSKNRTYYIVLVDEDEANLWLSYITEAIHEAKYGPTPTIAPTSEPTAAAVIVTESSPPQDSVNQIIEPETAVAIPEPVPTSTEAQPDAGAERQARLDALRAERIARDVAAQKLREMSDAGIASNEQDDALAAQAFAKELEARRKQEFEAEQSRQIAMRAAVEAEQARVAAKQAELNSQHAEAAAQAQRAQEALAAAEKAKKAEQQEWEAFISECATGFACKKHARGYFAKPHECLVFINLNSQTLSWGGKEEISMKVVTDIQPGKQTKVLSGTGSEIPADCCVGVVSVERTLDLEFPNASRRDNFVRNFKRLLARLQANQKKSASA